MDGGHNKSRKWLQLTLQTEMTGDTWRHDKSWQKVEEKVMTVTLGAEVVGTLCRGGRRGGYWWQTWQSGREMLEVLTVDGRLRRSRQQMTEAVVNGKMVGGQVTFERWRQGLILETARCWRRVDLNRLVVVEED